MRRGPGPFFAELELDVEVDALDPRADKVSLLSPAQAPPQQARLF